MKSFNSRGSRMRHAHENLPPNGSQIQPSNDITVTLPLTASAGTKNPKKMTLKKMIKGNNPVAALAKPQVSIQQQSSFLREKLAY